ncbi:prepilin peptidase [Legionella spiritensis]|uniref:Prepilin leader peptidase/N-methyltransferase n=1 Tax=Legionella spiritensis TaxID=452 RepID=A0A0W0YY45_LEGSP|nr:A24 family peptidase [Legionella spiritensis]KTD61805.1 type 4 (IV) prepilin-like protein leader peptide processing enzyme PilD [Legionella spiritensis]SNV38119.1 type 4 (IV) prepilin-like protein leader peptide processing enzyme PilD [Legionella spiritensis]
MEFFDMPIVYIYLFIGLFSLITGSFLNVVIHRLPLMLRSDWLNECRSLLNIKISEEPASINLFVPRSFCPSCGKMVKAFHNIPIISYLFLRGRCAYCGSAISLRYPLVEALTCLLSLLATWHFGLTLPLVFVLLYLWLIIPLFFIDLDQQLLPDCLTLSLLWMGLIANTQNIFTTLPNAVLSAAGAYLFLWLFIKLFYLITGKIGMGNGDFKLFAAFGAWFGWSQLPLILLLASFTGAISGLIYLKFQKKHKDTPIAFGPFLCMASLISLFFGQNIIDWYWALWFRP